MSNNVGPNMLQDNPCFKNRLKSMKIKSSLWYFVYTLTGKIFQRNVIYQTNKWQVDQHGQKNLMCLWILRNIWNTHIQFLIIDIFRTVYIDNVVKLRTEERLVAYFFIHCKNFLFWDRDLNLILNFYHSKFMTMKIIKKLRIYI